MIAKICEAMVVWTQEIGKGNSVKGNINGSLKGYLPETDNNRNKAKNGHLRNRFGGSEGEDDAEE